MPATHATTSLQASASVAAGSTQTSGSYDNRANYGALITARVTNGSTAPTTACVVTMDISAAGSVWFTAEQRPAGLVAGTAYPMVFSVPPEALYARIVFAGHTGAAVTVEAVSQALTGL